MTRVVFALATVATALSLAGCRSSSSQGPTESAASETTAVAVPDVVGRTLDKARDELKAAGVPIVSETDVRDGKTIIVASNWTVVQQTGGAAGVTLGVAKLEETPTPTPTVTADLASVAPKPTEPPAAPAAAPAAPPAAPQPADVYYKNCTAARAAGVAPLHRGDPGYRPGLDRDGDGIACE